MGEELMFCNSRYSKSWLLFVLPAGGGGGLYMISVMRKGGVAVAKVATVGPDHELDMGGLLGPVRLWWLGFQLRAKTRAFVERVITALLRLVCAAGLKPPP